jgi:hypothetical protein
VVTPLSRVVVGMGAQVLTAMAANLTALNATPAYAGVIAGIEVLNEPWTTQGASAGPGGRRCYSDCTPMSRATPSTRASGRSHHAGHAEGVRAVGRGRHSWHRVRQHDLGVWVDGGGGGDGGSGGTPSQGGATGHTVRTHANRSSSIVCTCSQSASVVYTCRQEGYRGLVQASCAAYHACASVAVQNTATASNPASSSSW